MTTPTTPQDRATAETDLLTCDGKTLQDFLYRIFNANPQRSALCDYEAFRDAIVRQALATRPVSARALSDAEVIEAYSASVCGHRTAEVPSWFQLTHEQVALVRDFARRIVALGASSSPDADALTAAKREGFIAGAMLEASRPRIITKHYGPLTPVEIQAEADRRYPIAPPSVVRCAVCKQAGADLSTGIHASKDECLEALGTALAATLSPTGAER